METAIRRGLVLTITMALAILACVGTVMAQTTEEKRERAASTREAQQAEPGRVIPGQYIVVLEDSDSLRSTAQNNGQQSQEIASDMAQEHGLDVSLTYGEALRGFAAHIPEDELQEVRSDPRVDFVVEDREVRASAQTLPTGVNRVDAEKSSVLAGNGSGAVNADIAVIDTGIYAKHPDLNVVGGKDCVKTDRKKSFIDDQGHGTHVAGSAAAKDNTVGVVGTAPGARLWSVKVLNSKGVGSTSGVICGIDWVTANAGTIEVANMSLGGSLSSGVAADDGNCGARDANAADAEHAAICNSVDAGVTYVVAAGNDTADTFSHYPAAFEEVITVSALADYNGLPGGGAAQTCNQSSGFDDDFAFFSNFGEEVDIGAPGVCIKSTYFKKKKVGKRKRIRIVPSYKSISGTSMASPHVAGAAAVHKSLNAAKTPDQIRSFMIAPTNSEAVDEGHTDIFGLNPEPVLQMDNY